MSDHSLGFRELADWMRARSMTLKDFEKISGVDRNAVWRLVHGHMLTVSIGLADKIAQATKGEVGLDQVRAYELRTQALRAQMRA